MDRDILPTGKLPIAFLDKLLKGLPSSDPNVLAGPGIGVDAAVIRFGDQILVFKTDPITFTSDKLPWYVVTINANDIACMGGTPRYLLVTFLLPEAKTTSSYVETLFSELREACRAFDITLVGGHTEVTLGIERPLAIGFMIGTAESDDLIRPSGAKPGNAVLLSKKIPIEAVSIIASEKGDALPIDNDLLEAARNLIIDPGISIMKEARIAMSHGGVTAMHDPTEGGLAMGLRELAVACGCGIIAYREQIPVLDIAEKILPLFSIDPLGALASGSLIVCCDNSCAEGILAAWAQNGIEGSLIGEITASPEILLIENNIPRPLPEFPSDEITKIF